MTVGVTSRRRPQPPERSWDVAGELEVNAVAARDGNREASSVRSARTIGLLWTQRVWQHGREHRCRLRPFVSGASGFGAVASTAAASALS
jgi:hypothetical protein